MSKRCIIKGCRGTEASAKVICDDHLNNPSQDKFKEGFTENKNLQKLTVSTNTGCPKKCTP